MYAAIKGIFENGQITFEQMPPTTEKTKVIVMFMTEETPVKSMRKKGVRIGSLVGKGYVIPDDFNAPLDDLK